MYLTVEFFRKYSFNRRSPRQGLHIVKDDYFRKIMSKLHFQYEISFWERKQSRWKTCGETKRLVRKVHPVTWKWPQIGPFCPNYHFWPCSNFLDVIHYIAKYTLCSISFYVNPLRLTICNND